MNREIKFRAKSNLTHERLDELDIYHENGWVCGGLVVSGKTHYILGEILDSDEDYISPSFYTTVIPETVGQYTGLKDVVGLCIYEGDWIIWCGASGIEDGIGIVKWDNDKSAYVIYVDDYNEHHLYDVHYADMRVVGNVYEKEDYDV